MMIYDRLNESMNYGAGIFERACNTLEGIIYHYKTWRYRNIHSGGSIICFFAALLPKFMLDNPQLFNLPDGWNSETVVADIYKEAENQRAEKAAYIINKIAHLNFDNEKLLFPLLIHSLTPEFNEFMVKIFLLLNDLDFNIETHPYLLYRAVLHVLPQLQEIDDQKTSYSGFTAIGIASLMAELADVKDTDHIYDGCCGFSILTSIAAAATKAEVYEQDVYFYPAVISRFIFLMIGKPQTGITLTDTLFNPNPDHPEQKFDLFLTHSPIGFRTDNNDMTEKIILAQDDGFNSNPRNDQWLFIRRAFQVLKDDGRGVALMSLTALSRDGRQYKDTRAEMIEKGYIYAIIELPSGLTGPSMTKWSIVLFDKKGGHDTVYFMDLSRPQTGHHFERTRRGVLKLDERRIPRLVEDIKNQVIYHNFTTIVSKKEIIQHEYRLNASLYLQETWHADQQLVESVKIMGNHAKAKREFEETSVIFESAYAAYNEYKTAADHNNGKEESDE